MDFLEENQLRIYELEEEKKSLRLEISEEQYANLCLHRKRNIFFVSIVKNIVIFLYFLFLFEGMRFFVIINGVWDSAKDNLVIGKLLELSDTAFYFIQIVLLIAMALSVAFFIRKLFLIWLNSDHRRAVQMAKRMRRQTFNKQIAVSDQKLAGYYFRLQEIEEELSQLNEYKE